MTESDRAAEAASSASPLRRKLKVVLITFGVVIAAFFTMYALTEDVGIAPFVYAIF
jgi:hypothetical protein